MQIPHLTPQGAQHVREHLAHFPRPDRAATDAVRAWAAERGVTIDPEQVDVVTLHYQPGREHPWEGVVVQKMSLAQALLANWQGESNNNWVGALFHSPWAGELPGEVHLVTQLRSHGALDNASDHLVFNGLFRRQQPQAYGPSTLIELPAEAFQRFVTELNFHQRYKAMLDQYWSGHLQTYRSSARLNFLAASNRQAAAGSLSRDAVRLVWQVAGVIRASRSLQVRALNVYGYGSTDLLYFKHAKRPLTVLFVPGNSSPLHEFADEGQLQDWFARQCKDLSKRAVLQSHFSAADATDGLSYSGLATALEGLAVYPQRNHLDANRPGFTAEGYWSPREYVNYKPDTYSPLISGDIFNAFAERQRRRSYGDADQLITSNGEVAKARWLGYISAAVNYLAPLALVIPALAPIFALGGIAQFGLGLDLAIEGHGLQEKAQGVEGAIFGVLNATPLVLEGVARAPTLYRYWSDAVVMPRRINEQWGYLLSPVDPPRLPACDIVEFFRDADSIAPIAEADEDVAQAVLRMPSFDGPHDRLLASIGNYPQQMIYDLELDAFLREADANEVSPTYYRAPRPGEGRDMQALKVEGRQVTDAMRMGTLRALGVDLHLPVELPSTPLAGATPIPRQVLSLWIGDQVLSEKLLDNIAANASRLEQARYPFKLYLSNASASAYSENLRLLQARAPSLQVIPLEEQPVFAELRSSPYHEHYQAALTGNGSGPAHYASAADLLRYRLLHHEGGLYMDIDDTLRTPGDYLAQREGRNLGVAGEAIDQVVLATTPDGLLLFPPVGDENMGIRCMFNNSLIGSHAQNPTLEAISAEMTRRWRSDPGFYDRLPRKSVDPLAFHRYAAKLAHITGPGLLTDIVKQRLPGLATVMQIDYCNAMSQRGLRGFIDARKYLDAKRHLMPLERIATIGANQSWVQ